MGADGATGANTAGGAEGPTTCDYCAPARRTEIGPGTSGPAHALWWREHPGLPPTLGGGSPTPVVRRLALCQACWRRLVFLRYLVHRGRVSDWPGYHQVIYHARQLAAPTRPTPGRAVPSATWPAWLLRAAGEMDAAGDRGDDRADGRADGREAG